MTRPKSAIPSVKDQREFKAFCRNATINQLREIAAKEQAAHRDIYETIAREELERRKRSEPA